MRSHLVAPISHALPALMINRNFVTWIVLVLLTLVSFLSSESSLGNYTVIALLAIMIIKCVLVGFQFMELKKAHFAWKLAFISAIGVFTLIISVIVMNTAQ